MNTIRSLFIRICIILTTLPLSFYDQLTFSFSFAIRIIYYAQLFFRSRLHNQLLSISSSPYTYFQYYHSNRLGKGPLAMRMLTISRCLMFLSNMFEMKMWSYCISYQMETGHSLRYLSENLSSKMTQFLVHLQVVQCPTYSSSRSN